MPTKPGLFPNSTPTGDAIPYDILYPSSTGVLDFTLVAAPFTLPTNASVLALRATKACYLNFGGTASVPASGTFVNDQVYIAEEEIVHVAVPSVSVSVIGEAEVGSLKIQVVQPWTSLQVETNSHRN